MKKLLSACLLFCLLAQNSFAKSNEPFLLLQPDKKEETKKKTQIRGLYALFPFEFPIIDNSAINAALNNAALPESQYGALAFGGGFQLQYNQFIFNLSAQSSNKKIKSDTADVSVAYLSYTLNVGYDLMPKPEYSLYPFAGYKYCSYYYLFNEKTTTQQTIGTYLTTPLDHKELKNTMHHLDLGIGFSYQKQLLLGLRAGYLIPIGSAKWKVNSNKATLQNSPDINYIGYVTLSIGYGNIKKYEVK